MPCTCSVPVPVVRHKRGYSYDERSHETICADCGEPLHGPLDIPSDEVVVYDGVDPRVAARKKAKNKKARSNRRHREVAPPEDPAIAGLQQGDKIVIRKVLDPFGIHVYPCWSYRDGVYASRPCELKAGMVFRVTDTGSRPHRAFGVSVVNLVGTGEDAKGLRFSLYPGKLLFDRLPRSYELPPARESK